MGNSLCLLSPSPGREHLCITLSISTSLAPILVQCELVFGKSHRGHLVTLSGTLELSWARMIMQREDFRTLWDFNRLPLGRFSGLVFQQHACIHALSVAQGNISELFCVSFHGFINNSRVREVSGISVLKQHWRHKTLLITSYKDIRNNTNSTLQINSAQHSNTSYINEVYWI